MPMFLSAAWWQIGFLIQGQLFLFSRDCPHSEESEKRIFSELYSFLDGLWVLKSKRIRALVIVTDRVDIYLAVTDPK